MLPFGQLLISTLGWQMALVAFGGTFSPPFRWRWP